MRTPWQTFVQPTVEEILRTSQVPGMGDRLDKGGWTCRAPCPGDRWLRRAAPSRDPLSRRLDHQAGDRTGYPRLLHL